MIRNFRDEYQFLSNFYRAPVEIKGVTYPTVEHAYQAQKSPDPDYQRRVATATTPREAKTLGRQADLRDDWEIVKELIMLEAVHEKFAQNPDLRERLVDTWGHKIVEGNTWHDQEWGDCSCPQHADTPGKNTLGIILMCVRATFAA